MPDDFGPQDSTLKRSAGVALWRQIRQAIEREIAAGRLATGGRLPTEQELARRFAVNRHTVRQALASLRQDGIVRVEQGRGCFVQQKVVSYPIRRRTRFTEVVAGQARTPSSQVIDTGTVCADAAIADALGIARQAPVAWLERLSEVDGQPIGVSSHYLPLPRFDGIAEVFRQTGSITGALARFGLTDYQRLRSSVTARLPGDSDAARLLQPRSRPILVIESTNVDPADQPVEFVVTRMAADWVQLVIEP